MKRALLASLDAWQKYWGNGFYVYLLLAACLYFLVFGRKKERARILSGYIVVFLAVFFCPVTAYIIQKCIGRSVYWRVLWVLPAVPPGKKGGSFQTTAVHTSDFYCGSAGFLRN